MRYTRILASPMQADEHKKDLIRLSRNYNAQVGINDG